MSTMSTPPSEIPREAKLQEIRVVLVGKTGAGKSATGNTIVGEKVFPVNATGLSTESQCQYKKFVRFEKKVLLIDTPGVFDTDRSPEVIKDEIHKFLLVSAPGPHAIILVTSAAWRFTPEEVGCIQRLQDMFGRGLSKHLFIIITRTENWEEDGVTAKSYLGGLPKEAKAVLKEALDGDRVLPFQNTLRGQAGEPQVRQLLDMISKHIEANGGACYTNDQWQEAEREMQEKIRLLLEKQEKAEKEKSEEIKKLAMTKLEEEQHEKMEEIKRQHKQDMEELDRQIKEAEAEDEDEREIMLRNEKEKLKRGSDEAAATTQNLLPVRQKNYPAGLQDARVKVQTKGTEGSPIAPDGTSEPPPRSHAVSEELFLGSQGRPQKHPHNKAKEPPRGNSHTGSLDNEKVPGGGKQRMVNSPLKGEGRQMERADRSSGGTLSLSGNHSKLEGRPRTTMDRMPPEVDPLHGASFADRGHMETSFKADGQPPTHTPRQEPEMVRMLLEHMEKKDAENRRAMTELMQFFEREKNEMMRLMESRLEEKMRDSARPPSCQIM